MKSLLYPAVSLMNRLSFGMKFSLISVLFLVPMLVTNFYLVRDSYREFQGTRVELQSLDLLGSSLALRRDLETLNNLVQINVTLGQSGKAGNIEAQRAAAQAQAEADEAQRAAALASKDTVKGLRQVTRYAVDDHKALLNWIARNRRDDLTAFIDEWAKRHHKDCAGADGLRVWQEKEAF